MSPIENGVGDDGDIQDDFQAANNALQGQGPSEEEQSENDDEGEETPPKTFLDSSESDEEDWKAAANFMNIGEEGEETPPKTFLETEGSNPGFMGLTDSEGEEQMSANSFMNSSMAEEEEKEEKGSIQKSFMTVMPPAKALPPRPKYDNMKLDLTLPPVNGEMIFKKDAQDRLGVVEARMAYLILANPDLVKEILSPKRESDCIEIALNSGEKILRPIVYELPTAIKQMGREAVLNYLKNTGVLIRIKFNELEINRIRKKLKKRPETEGYAIYEELVEKAGLTDEQIVGWLAEGKISVILPRHDAEKIGLDAQSREKINGLVESGEWDRISESPVFLFLAKRCTRSTSEITDLFHSNLRYLLYDPKEISSINSISRRSKLILAAVLGLILIASLSFAFQKQIRKTLAANSEPAIPADTSGEGDPEPVSEPVAVVDSSDISPVPTSQPTTQPTSPADPDPTDVPPEVEPDQPDPAELIAKLKATLLRRIEEAESEAALTSLLKEIEEEAWDDEHLITVLADETVKSEIAAKKKNFAKLEMQREVSKYTRRIDEAKVQLDIDEILNEAKLQVQMGTLNPAGLAAIETAVLKATKKFNDEKAAQARTEINELRGKYTEEIQEATETVQLDKILEELQKISKENKLFKEQAFEGLVLLVGRQRERIKADQADVAKVVERERFNKLIAPYVNRIRSAQSKLSINEIMIEVDNDAQLTDEERQKIDNVANKFKFELFVAECSTEVSILTSVDKIDSLVQGCELLLARSNVTESEALNKLKKQAKQRKALIVSSKEKSRTYIALIIKCETQAAVTEQLKLAQDELAKKALLETHFSRVQASAEAKQGELDIRDQANLARTKRAEYLTQINAATSAKQIDQLLGKARAEAEGDELFTTCLPDLVKAVSKQKEKLRLTRLGTQERQLLARLKALETETKIETRVHNIMKIRQAHVQLTRGISRELRDEMKLKLTTALTTLAQQDADVVNKRLAEVTAIEDPEVMGRELSKLLTLSNLFASSNPVYDQNTHPRVQQQISSLLGVDETKRIETALAGLQTQLSATEAKLTKDRQKKALVRSQLEQWQAYSGPEQGTRAEELKYGKGVLSELAQSIPVGEIRVSALQEVLKLTNKEQLAAALKAIPTEIQQRRARISENETMVKEWQAYNGPEVALKEESIDNGKNNIKDLRREIAVFQVQNGILEGILNPDQN